MIAALICSGSSGQRDTISARSGGSSEVSISPCSRDLGVNWGVNGVFDVSQVFVLAELTFFLQRTLKTITYLKKSFFGYEGGNYRPRLGQNQGLWSQNGDTMSPGLGGVFPLVEKVILRRILASDSLRG